MKLVPTNQPALIILPPRQFCSLIGWQVKRPSNAAINFFMLRPQCIWRGVKESEPIFWAHVRSSTCLTLPREMFIAQLLILQVLRNTFDIHVLTAVNHSETDWNIGHAFWIWAYTDYFGNPRTPLMSVFGVRSECAFHSETRVGKMCNPHPRWSNSLGKHM